MFDIGKTGIKTTSKEPNLKLVPGHPPKIQNMSDSSNHKGEYLRITLDSIKQIPSLQSCKDPDICNAKDINMQYLLTICADFAQHKYGTKSTSATTQSIFSEIASSTINNTVNQMYDEDLIFDDLYTQSSSTITFKSKSRKHSEDEELRLEQAWSHYMQFHKGIGRKNECKKKDKCPWVEHVRMNENNEETKHRLLAKCINRKQLLHVYFYHSDDYDKSKNDKSRKERYVGNSEDSQVISIDNINNENGVHIPVISPADVVRGHQHQNTESGNIDYPMSEILPYGMTKMETDVSSSRIKKVCEPGTPFNDTMGMDVHGGYDGIIIHEHGKGDSDNIADSMDDHDHVHDLGDMIHMNDSSDVSVMHIEMTEMNHGCIDGESCEILMELLEYGSAENCNLPDVEPKYQPDGPEQGQDMQEDTNVNTETDPKNEDDSDKLHVEEEAKIKEYLHCITGHSKFKQTCKGKVCGYKIWKNYLQQTMRQMIHSEFYQHADSIEIVIENEEHVQLKITVGDDIDSNHKRKGSSFNNNGEMHMTPICEHEEEEEDKDDEKASYVKSSRRLQPITYIPTQLEILKSQTRSHDPDDTTMSAKILQFGCPFTEQEPKFKNPKMEILNNDFFKISVKDWNDVLKKCVGLSKSLKAKAIKLSIKQLVALKLYTDLLSICICVCLSV